MTGTVIPFDQATEAARRYHEAYLDEAIGSLRDASSFIVIAVDHEGNMTPYYRCNAQEMALAGAILIRRAAEPKPIDLVPDFAS